MKVLQVTAVDFTLKKFLLPLIDALNDNGFEVHTACHCSDISKELRSRGYVLHHIPFSRNINVLKILKSLILLIRLIKKEKYDYLHTHTPLASVIARFAAKIAGVPCIIYTAHGFYFHENMSPLIYKLFFLIEKIWGKYFSDYILFQSREDYELALKNQFNLPNRLIHIGNGVSPLIFNPDLYDREKLREKFKLQRDDIVLIFVGRLVKEKGIIELIESFQLIKKQEKKYFLKLWIVGGSVQGDRDQIHISDFVDRLPAEVRNDIILFGLRDDIPELLVASDIFVLPSYREGLPRSIIEAMAMGKPIIATDIRGCREEVFPNVNGFLCRRQDATDLTDKINALIKSREKLNEFGKASRNLFLSQFNEQLVIEKQMKLFNTLRGKKGICIKKSLKE